jgi:SulP family sulfate permease
MFANRTDLLPKLFTYARRGYDFETFKKDTIAGLTVAIVALPLSMAIAIASGVSPAVGLKTAFVAGFWISALGGSRFQVGGPTAAFALVVANIIQTHGMDGLLLATMMAGIMLMLSGWLKLGIFLKYIPNSVVIGFTTGIAVTIFITQIPAFFGLTLTHDSTEIVEKLKIYAAAWQTANPFTIMVSIASLALMIFLRKNFPKLPFFLIAVVFFTLLVGLLHLPTQTVGDKFGTIITTIPDIVIPKFDFKLIREMIPSAFTIAFLAGIESLLSAVVSDGMTGARHRPNAELMGQGFANIMSAITGGLPATGAIARTATNIRAGARTPMAGVMHATLLLLILLIAGRLTSYIPLSVLSAILMIVAWNMAEIGKLIRFVKVSGGSDRTILFITLFLTVFADLTIAVEVGVVLGAMFLMHKMSSNFEIENVDADHHSDMRERLPPNCEMFQINGPLFFGAVNTFIDAIENITTSKVKWLIIDMAHVPFTDASGLSAFEKIFATFKKYNGKIIFSGTKERIATDIQALVQSLNRTDMVYFVSDFDEAVALASS